MTPDDQAKLARQQRIARAAEIVVEGRKPLEGQRELFDGRRGWGLVCSRPPGEADGRRMDRQAAEEAEARGGKPKGKRKRKGDDA